MQYLKESKPHLGDGRAASMYFFFHYHTDCSVTSDPQAPLSVIFKIHSANIY